MQLSAMTAYQNCTAHRFAAKKQVVQLDHIQPTSMLADEKKKHILSLLKISHFVL